VVLLKEEDDAQVPVSVVIPACNAQKYIADALESVLGQSRLPREIVVVDDGSCDATPSIVSSFRARGVQLIQQENAGPASARNAGIAGTSAKWIAFLDADDIWTTEAIETHLASASANPMAALVWGLTELKLEDDGELPAEDWHGLPQWGMCLSSMMIRRSAFASVGTFAVDMRYGEDLDLLIRLKEKGHAFAKHDHIVSYRRLHGTNLTRRKELVDRAVLVAVQKAFERRRRRQMADPAPSDEIVTRSQE
jgi:glycosyltransferase involved in cell wall biosynthesis